MSFHLDQILDGGLPLTSLSEAGMTGIKRQQSREYQRDLTAVARLYTRVLEGDRMAAFYFSQAMRGGLRESLTTSDFPNLFGDIIDRQVLAAYQEVPYTWNQYCKRGTIQDFRQAKRFRVDGGTAVLEGPLSPAGLSANRIRGQAGSTGIEQDTEYPEAQLNDSKYVVQLAKYGRRMPFAWETMVNDDLDALKDTPARFGRAARRTEEKKVTELYVASTGPNSTFFSAANKNILTSAVNAAVTTNNAPLSITSLQQALIVMMSQTDQDGEPISIEAVTLVVPPALKVVAMNILNASQVWMNDQGGTSGLYGSGATQSQNSLQRLLAQNWAQNIVKVAVNYYLPIVDTTRGNTAWYLFADPNDGRPAMEMDFLRGHENPDLFMKLPNQVQIGEGRMGPGASALPGTANTNPLDGDFDTDAIHYKVRHVLGGTLLDPLMAVCSNGSGS